LRLFGTDKQDMLVAKMELGQWMKNVNTKQSTLRYKI